jgi:NAD-dependent SIR2 family protein deacetylase
MNDSETRYRAAAELIAGADALLITAGAGVGIDSGLPDFRGNEGFWRAYPALGRARLDFYEMASPAAFRARPQLAWGFYGHRLDLYRRTLPHRGFELLRQWGERTAHGSFVFTSNVDGQFQKAGFAADRIFECHGSIHHLQCLDVCRPVIWRAADFVPAVDADTCELRNAAPRCPHCGALARPNILMFGDGEWLDQHAGAQAAALERWLAGVRKPAIIELGAGTAVPSVRHFSERSARRFAVPLIRINPREPQVPRSGDIALPMAALSALRAIDEALLP